MAEEKDGGMELLREEHFGQINPWGQPVVGWNPISEGFGGIFNPRGWAFLRVVLWKMLKGEKVSLYDQPVIVENPGAIVIVEYNGRIGLVQIFRMVGDRVLPKAAGDYISQLNEKKLWSQLLENLGRWTWEAPRGLIVDTAVEDLEPFVLKTAKMEAAQEAGFQISEMRIAGMINVNSTFFVHPQYVVYGKLQRHGRADQENLEIIGNSRFFTMKELREMNSAGQFDDGLTLAALALCGFSL